jgi:ketosteroid isomerase-like protein
LVIAAQTEQERNLEYARRAFEAFSEGDAQAFGDAFAPESAYRGPDQLKEYFRFVQQRTDGAYRLVPIAFAASGNKVFVEYHVKSTQGGRSFESDGVICLTVVAGKTLEVANYLEVCRRRGLEIDD